MKKSSSFYNFGFTLIELLVVIAIIGILSSVVIASLNSARIKARDTSRISQVKEVQKALEMYFLIHEHYPANVYALSFGDNIPHQWQSVMNTLSSEGFISINSNGVENKNTTHFSLINTAYAAGNPVYYPSTKQDPLYKTYLDFPYSHGYVASTTAQSYKIRVYLEDSNSPFFRNTVAGTFLDSSTSGQSACDKNPPFQYYCIESK